MPVIVTIVWLWSAGYDVHWWLGLLAVVTIVFVHAAGNVWSDIADYRKGVDAPDVVCTRLLVDGVFTVQEFKRLSISLNCVAVLLGLGITLTSCEGKLDVENPNQHCRYLRVYPILSQVRLCGMYCGLRSLLG